MMNDIREEWRIRDVEQKADRAVSKLYELDSLRSDMGSLERTAGQASPDINELRYALETAINRIERLESEVERLMSISN